MKDPKKLIAAVRVEQAGLPVTKTQAIEQLIKAAVTDEMVNRFLSWPLPRDFSPDCGITFKPIDHPHCWPIGTNLLTADQARAMLMHVLSGSPR